MIDKTTGTYKALKITRPNGSVNYHPDNKTNLRFHTEKKRSLSREKKEKYLIEQVKLTLEEAAELGFDEAKVILNPPKAKKQIDTNEMFAQLLEQNQQLINALASRTAPAEPTESESKPKTKK